MMTNSKKSWRIKIRLDFRSIFSKLQKNLGFRFSVISLIVLSQLFIAIVILQQIRVHVREAKLRDVWAILFLEMEKTARELADELMGNRKESRSQNTTAETGEFILELNNSLKYQSGKKWIFSSLDELNIRNRNELKRWNIVRYGTAFFVVAVTGKKGSKLVLRIQPFLEEIALPVNHIGLDQTKIYLSTRQAQLVYSNSPTINQDNFAERQLVQQFINMPLWQAQLQLEKNTKEDFYGFFTEVPGTNLIIFAETDARVVTNPVLELVTNIAIKIAWSLLFVTIVIQIVLYFLLRPVSSLVANAAEVSKGNFLISQKHMGFGELFTLASSFQEMAKSLILRDQSIEALTKEQIEKVRLLQEMQVAKEIQASFLPRVPLPVGSGLQIDTTYIPATEVAGDWFSYAYDKDTNQTIVAIIDVSGHGAGASMYTAIAAALFREFTKRFFNEKCEDTEFFDAFDFSLKEFGQSRWSASGQLYFYRPNLSELTLINAGHPGAYVSAENGGFVYRRMPSPLLGMREENDPFARLTLPFKPGACAVSYTDGLIERYNPAGVKYGAPKLRKTLENLSKKSPNQIVQALKISADEFGAERPPDDDTCIVVLKGL